VEPDAFFCWGKFFFVVGTSGTKGNSPQQAGEDGVFGLSDFGQIGHYVNAYEE
jgi:hypothetical protein